MNGKLYGVGVGPGDPELVTLKAVRVLRIADVVIAPKASEGRKSIALSIARRHISENAVVEEMVFPMENGQKLEGYWERCCDRIVGYIRKGKKVAFVTLGDPMIYSTYIYIFNLVRQKGCTVETIPGIVSFCDAAARAGRSLAAGDRELVVVPAVVDTDRVAYLMENFSSMVLMKVSRNYDSLVDLMKEKGFLEDSVLVSRCGYYDQVIEEHPERLKGKQLPYLSMILARREGEKVDGSVLRRGRAGRS